MQTRKRERLGRPLAWGEPKTRTTLSLTPTALLALDKLAAQENVRTKCELLEQLARGTYKLVRVQDLRVQELDSTCCVEGAEG